MTIDLSIILSVGKALGTALLVCFVTTPIARVLAYRVGAVDVPKDGRRMHDHPIPRMGGLAIFFGVLVGVLLNVKLDRQLQGMLLGSVIIITVGMVDDVVPLPALLKFLLQILAAWVAVAHGIVMDYIANPFFTSDKLFLDFGVWSVPITILWIVGITNSVNLIDGLDGLAAGVSAISSMSMLVIALVLGKFNEAIVLAAVVGACVGFMPYNFNPARIFMGDSGALFLGFVLACVSVTGLLKSYTLYSFALPLLALGLPIFDTAFAIIRRLLKGQNPMHPDRGHFHHRLIDMGLSQKQSVAVLYSISAVLGLSAVLITSSEWTKALLVILGFCAAMVIGVVLIRDMDARGKEALRKKKDLPDAPEASEKPEELEKPEENREDPVRKEEPEPSSVQEPSSEGETTR